MDKSALVSIEVDRGAQILSILDQARIKISVALFVHLSEYEAWRLVLAGRQLDGTPRLQDAYGLLHKALDAAGFAFQKTPPMLILPMDDPFIKALRRIFGKSRSVEGMILGGQSIGNRFVEEGYVYRIS
jgi:hypothetical protein